MLRNFSGTGEGGVPRCRRGCSPVPNPSLPGAGEKTLQIAFWTSICSLWELLINFIIGAVSERGEGGNCKSR